MCPSSRGKNTVRVTAALLLATISTIAHASELSGLPRVVDADTVYLGNAKIRLEGVDAPEMEQVCLDADGAKWQCGVAARSALETHAGASPWTCRSSGSDRYGRILARCTVGGEDAGSWLVRSGHALAFRKYSTAYVQDEDFARQNERGLWKGAFIAPWDWRSRSSKTIILGATSVSIEAQRSLGPDVTAAPPDPNCVIKGNLRRAPSCIYHLPGGHFYDRLGMKDINARRWFCSEAEALAAGCRASKR